MKVSFRHIAFVVWATLFSCSGSDSIDSIPEPQPQAPTPISFRANQGEEEEVTRAVGLEEKNITSFKVWAYKNDAVNAGNYTSYQVVMPGYTVNYGNNTAYTTTSNTNDWEYVTSSQEIKYWDFKAEAYRFFGYALGNATSPATPNVVSETGAQVSDAPTATEVTFTSTVDATTEEKREAAPYFSELWFSNDKDNDYGKLVTLIFFKPFTRVRVMFTFSLPEVTRTNISDFTFAPTDHSTIPQSGTITIHYPLKGTDTKETHTTTFTNDDETTNALSAITLDYYECSDSSDPAYANREHWYTVVPRTTQGSYTMTATIFGEQKSVVIPEQYMQWKPGYQYTYIFKITDSGALTLDVIQVAIDQWKSKGSSNRYVYNW